MNKIFLSILIILSFVSTSFAKDYYWLEDGIELSAKTFKAGVEQQHKFSNDLTEQSTYVYVGGKLNNTFIIPGFYQSFTKTKTGWAREYRPRLDIVNSDKIFNIPYSRRLRIEYRDMEKKDEIRFREMLTVYSPYCFTTLKLQPYISDELTYTDGKAFNRNRLRIGILSKEFFYKNLTLDTYYTFEQNKDNEDNAIFGTKIKAIF